MLIVDACCSILKRRNYFKIIMGWHGYCSSHLFQLLMKKFRSEINSRRVRRTCFTIEIDRLAVFIVQTNRYRKQKSIEDIVNYCVSFCKMLGFPKLRKQYPILSSRIGKTFTCISFYQENFFLSILFHYEVYLFAFIKLIVTTLYLFIYLFIRVLRDF